MTENHRSPSFRCPFQAEEESSKNVKGKKPASRFSPFRAAVFLTLAFALFFLARRFDLFHWPPRGETRPDTSPTSADGRSIFTPPPVPVPIPENKPNDFPDGSKTTDKSSPSQKAKPRFVNVAVPDRLRTIRVASWNLYPLDFAKITDPTLGPKIAEIIAGFDLTAVSGFRGQNRALAEGLLHLLNGAANGNENRFDFVASQKISAEGDFQAFFYNRERIGIDRRRLYDVIDQEGRLVGYGLTAGCCALGPPVEERFTFTLLSVRLPEEADAEKIDVLADLYQTVRNQAGRDGVTEDDIILVGSFGVPVQRLGAIRRIPNLAATSADLPSVSDGRAADHIIFDLTATTEYVERFGVLVPADRYGLSGEEAAHLARHYPVWADFSVLENSASEN